MSPHILTFVRILYAMNYMTPFYILHSKVSLAVLLFFAGINGWLNSVIFSLLFWNEEQVVLTKLFNGQKKDKRRLFNIQIIRLRCKFTQ